MEAVDDFFRQNNAERVPEFADLEFNHGDLRRYYYCNNI